MLRATSGSLVSRDFKKSMSIYLHVRSDTIQRNSSRIAEMFPVRHAPCKGVSSNFNKQQNVLVIYTFIFLNINYLICSLNVYRRILEQQLNGVSAPRGHRNMQWRFIQLQETLTSYIHLLGWTGYTL